MMTPWMLRMLVCSIVFAPLSASLTDGLVGHWKFDGSDGKTVRDRSSKGNDGVIIAGEIRTEKAGASLEFNGLDTTVVIKERTAFGLKGAVTALFWVRPYEMKRYSLLFGRPHTNGSWITPMFGMYFAGVQALFGMASDKDKLQLDSADAIVLDVWTHLAATYDGTKAVFYLNGEPKNERACTGAIRENGEPLYIGSPAWRNASSIRGRVSELMLFDRALTSAEVLAHFDSTKGSYDRTRVPVAQTFRDGTVPVASPGNTAGDTWRNFPTRTLDLLDGYTPKAAAIRVNTYGGWLDAPKEKATGFFYTKKIGDRWWLIDPEGCRFIHIAMNWAQPSAYGDTALKKKFGTKEKWAEETSRIFFENGFNGKGSGRMTEIPLSRAVQRPLPYTWELTFMASFGRSKKLTFPMAGHAGYSNECIPVFHPDFEPFCNEYAKEVLKAAHDPYLVGVFSDNELLCPLDLLDRHLTLDTNNPDLKHGYDAASVWMKENLGHTDIARCGRRERLEFIAFVYERYYRIVSAAIRTYDSEHLYIGTRLCFETQFDNPYFMKMTGKYLDVTSVNYYGVWGPDRAQMASWHEWTGKPIIISEWYAKAEDAGLANVKGAGWLVRTQSDRAKFYQHYVLGLLESKVCVGSHWFKYQDDPKESKALDAVGGANKGMFDGDYEPHQPLLDYAKAVNREAYLLTEFFDSRK